MLTRQHHITVVVDASTLLVYDDRMPSTLTRQELDSWLGFRYMVEETSLSVSRALIAATGMSGGQFGILSILAQVPQNSMRQQELADAMRWDRTRLSHVLTRMEARGWIKRAKGEKGATIVLLDEAGSREQRTVAPLLARIVKERFFNRRTQVQPESLREIRKAFELQ